MTGERDRLPAETLSPLAKRVDEALAHYRYEMRPAIEAIDAAIEGFGGLFDPGTADSEKRAAIDAVLAADPPAEPAFDPAAAEAGATEAVLYVDGSSRGNPGPAGAGAVVQAGDATLRLGRPVGSRADNNVAEYAALHLGLDALVARFAPETVEVRIDSMTVIDAVWGDAESPEWAAVYRRAIDDRLAAVDARWTHLVDSDPNPADARATVGADIAALGPG